MAPKTKTSAPNGAAPKSKPAKAAPAPNPSPGASGTATPSAPLDDDQGKAGLASRAGRPDKAAYDAEQEGIKKEIDALQLKLVSYTRFKMG